MKQSKSKLVFKFKFNINLDKNEDSFHFLADANNTCEWMGSIYIKYVMGIIAGIVTSCFISVIYSWLVNEHLNVKDCFHIFQVM